MLGHFRGEILHPKREPEVKRQSNIFENVFQWGGSSANKIFQTQDVVSYNATITACEKGSHWEEAMLLLYEVQKPGDQSERKPDSSGRNAKCFKDDLTLQLVKFNQIHTNSLKWWDVGMEKCQWIWQL